MKLIFSVATVAVAVVAAAWMMDYRINRTSSHPPGIYQMTAGQPEKGGLVIFCLPDTKVIRQAVEREYLLSGLCDSGTLPNIKKLVAVAGDSVSVTLDGVSVNGGPIIANSKPLTSDPSGRPLPLSESGVIPAGQVFLVSDYNPISFDSRYYGAVSASAIYGSINPVYTWSK